MEKVEIGIIGGSGVGEIEGLTGVKKIRVTTPFGSPSSRYRIGELEGKKVAFLPRHGDGHCFLPSEINFRANIYGFKKLGTEYLISLSAVGSMKEKIRPGQIIIPDQFVDLTKKRAGTFFGHGLVAHVGMAEPVCSCLSKILYTGGKKLGYSIKKGGTYLCIEGPQFSTQAESRIYRQWGVDLIGMTNMPEAKLAREAGLCYATLALVTDYDCWHSAEENVTVEMIVRRLLANVDKAKKIIREAVKKIPVQRKCSCAEATRSAVITNPQAIPVKTKKDLQLIMGRC